MTRIVWAVGKSRFGEMRWSGRNEIQAVEREQAVVGDGVVAKMKSGRYAIFEVKAVRDSHQDAHGMWHFTAEVEPNRYF